MIFKEFFIALFNLKGIYTIDSAIHIFKRASVKLDRGIKQNNKEITATKDRMRALEFEISTLSESNKKAKKIKENIASFLGN